MNTEYLKVGELAKRTGVSVRTLHYYDELGLLSPSVRGGGGHRLYASADVQRLLRIRALQALGFSLDDVRRALDGDDFPLEHVLATHLSALEQKIARENELRRRLEGFLRELRGRRQPTVEDLLEMIMSMERIESYYTPEQLEKLRERGKNFTEADQRRVQAEWNQLFADVRSAMERGVDPRSAEARELAQRRRTLIEGFTGGDPGIEESLRRMYSTEPDIASGFGYTPDPDVNAFLGRAEESE